LWLLYLHPISTSLCAVIAAASKSKDIVTLSDIEMVLIGKDRSNRALEAAATTSFSSILKGMEAFLSDGGV